MTSNRCSSFPSSGLLHMTGLEDTGALSSKSFSLHDSREVADGKVKWFWERLVDEVPYHKRTLSPHQRRPHRLAGAMPSERKLDVEHTLRHRLGEDISPSKSLSGISASAGTSSAWPTSLKNGLVKSA